VSEGDYLNCPFTQEEYERFHAAIVSAEKAEVHDFDNTKFFEGCLPIEVMAHRGVETLRFGPMKPAGLRDPRTGHRPYAVVQLRQDNLAGDHYSLVGFQTQLKWGEQPRVLRMIPGLEHAEFVRLGMIHRNTYINGPTVLCDTWQTRARPICFSRARSPASKAMWNRPRPVSWRAGMPRGSSWARLRWRRRARLRSARWRTTFPTRMPRTTSRRTSRSGSCRRWARRRNRVTIARWPPVNVPLAALENWIVETPRVSAARSNAPTGLVELKAAFLDHARHNRNLSPNTVRAYDTDLSQLVQHLAARHTRKPSELTLAHFDTDGVRRLSRGFARARHQPGLRGQALSRLAHLCRVPDARRPAR
jgi:hypothetical protein